jgi:Lrp/AsnC family transcriptional regulator for asnA, asnC and gidA
MDSTFTRSGREISDVAAALAHLDEIDLRIIGALRGDGRRPVAQIARELGVPKSTVQRRLDALIRERVITVAAIADHDRLGLTIHAQLNLSIDLQHYQTILDAISTLTEVHWLAVTTGPKDLVAEGFFASATHLHEFIREKLAPIPGIKSIETSVILKVEKLSFHWDELLREAARHLYPPARLSIPAAAALHAHNGDSDAAVTTHDSVTYVSDARCRGPGPEATFERRDYGVVGEQGRRDT